MKVAKAVVNAVIFVLYFVPVLLLYGIRWAIETRIALAKKREQLEDVEDALRQTDRLLALSHEYNNSILEANYTQALQLATERENVRAYQRFFWTGATGDFGKEKAQWITGGSTEN